MNRIITIVSLVFMSFWVSPLVGQEESLSDLPDFTGNAVVMLLPRIQFPSGCAFTSKVTFIHNYPGQDKYFVQFVPADCLTDQSFLLGKKKVTLRVSVDGVVIINIKDWGVARLTPEFEQKEQIKAMYPYRSVTARYIACDFAHGVIDVAWSSIHP